MPAPNNTLVINAQPPPPSQCQGGLAKALAGYESGGPAIGNAGPPEEIVVRDCGATVQGCHLGPDGRYDGFPFSVSVGSGKVLYDSTPGWSAAASCPAGTQSITISPINIIKSQSPPTDFCTAPCVLTNGICICDPPIPSHLPREFQSSRANAPVANARQAKSHPRVEAAARPIFTALNPTLRAPGVPTIFKYCDCESKTDYEESLNGVVA